MRCHVEPRILRCICQVQARQYHTTPISREAKSNAKQPVIDRLDGEIDAMPWNVMQHNNRKSFVKWASTKGRQYRDCPTQPGTNYLDGKPYPFPLNPTFQPQAPISKETKENVYEDWIAGSGLQQVSLKFGLSLARVEAILKLRKVQDTWHDQVSTLEALLRLI